MGPPSDAAGHTNDVTCASSLETAVLGQWVCEHRDPSIRSMVAFRRLVAGTDINHWWDDGNDAIAFSRGDKGFVAINNEATPVAAAVPSGLAPGVYCDLLTGGRGPTGCIGTRLVVDTSGAIQVQLNPTSAVAIDVATRL
jgi:alpha-amylase